MDAIIRLDRYQKQFKFLAKYKIDTWEHLAALEQALQDEVEALVNQRKGLYRQKRKNPESETLLSDITSIHQSIRIRRHELRLCAQIEASVPMIRQKLHEQPPKAQEKTKAPVRHRTRPHLR
ncbi:MAG: hypothetical protein HFF09_02580 [Oscillospiraceae bacterium]|nr:hypothetical protein [Oscillospiraceae bacterium]